MNLKQKFRSTIKRGTGEAYILIKENPTADFSEEIIKACLFNLAYDQRLEGDRENYLAELIRLSHQKDKILPAIYEALNTKIDDGAIQQLFNLVAIFAVEGDERAKKAIHKNYYRYAMDGVDWAGRDAVIEAEGLEGLKYVAETKGKLLGKFPDDWEDSFVVDSFQKDNPAIDVYDELRKAAEDNQHIKKYLETIEEHKFTIYKPGKEKKIDYKYVKDVFEKHRLGIIGPRACEKLSKIDLKKLADDFLQEKDRLKQQKYLGVFRYVKFPYDYQPIFKLVKTKKSKKDRVFAHAIGALQFFRAKDIRQFAFEKLSVTKKPEDYVDLLIGNYQKGDWKLLKSIAEKSKSDKVIHSLGFSYIDIYEANPTKECKEPLEVIYDKMNCGLHRRTLVEILIENDVLSDRIKNEIQFDSSEGTRKLYAEITS